MQFREEDSAADLGEDVFNAGPSFLYPLLFSNLQTKTVH